MKNKYKVKQDGEIKITILFFLGSLLEKYAEEFEKRDSGYGKKNRCEINHAGFG
ncbi:hypothetical protein ACRCJS_06190 [Aerococcus urinaeequi]|uniref:Uncharacterized protein n=1 Tax=Aerococcus urinaeequi TaxID=51665 RepID=A0AAF0BJJ7_9LACT|nr:hypothetical protein [Aerococcus urinaeequi]WCG37306.1 hypothetical protein PML80_07185 [Aerococcus urinaeequi]